MNNRNPPNGFGASSHGVPPDPGVVPFGSSAPLPSSFFPSSYLPNGFPMSYGNMAIPNGAIPTQPFLSTSGHSGLLPTHSTAALAHPMANFANDPYGCYTGPPNDQHESSLSSADEWKNSSAEILEPPTIQLNPTSNDHLFDLSAFTTNHLYNQLVQVNNSHQTRGTEQTFRENYAANHPHGPSTSLFNPYGYYPSGCVDLMQNPEVLNHLALTTKDHRDHRTTQRTSAFVRQPNPNHKVGPGTNNVRVRTKDTYRTVYTDQQRVELEKEYRTTQFINPERKAQLSAELQLTERQVKIWFQNRIDADTHSSALETPELSPVLITIEPRQ